jgi:hypothetical protein
MKNYILFWQTLIIPMSLLDPNLTWTIVYRVDFWTLATPNIFSNLHVPFHHKTHVVVLKDPLHLDVLVF